jgi:hypothetical protein
VSFIAELCAELLMMTLKVSQFLQGFAKVSIAQRLLTIMGKSDEELLISQMPACCPFWIYYVAQVKIETRDKR